MSANDSSRGGLDLAFGTSFLATMAVAVAPSFITFGFLVWSRPDPHPVLATIVSLIATAGAFVLGSKVWASQPESHGYSFADLMLWHWVRREWAEEKLIRNARLLGYDRQGRFVGKVEISAERQLFAAREIGAALDAKSSYTLNHSKRVEKHARDVAAALGLTAQSTEELATAAALHDIGNIRIPEHVIRKSGELTIEERSTIEGHVLLGALMAFEAGGEGVVQGLRHHHEHWDGKGYPNGLKGEEIPLYARIIGIAEAYDAMTSTRPYRQSLTQDQAVAVLREEAGTQFDPNLVEAFATTLPEPLQIVERVPALAWAQRQIRELTILFRRVGGTAASAAASTLAIALILGTALLKPDVFPGGGDGSGGTRPDRRMIAEGTGELGSTRDRITLAAVPDAPEFYGESLAITEAETAVGPRVIEDVEVLGERIHIDGHHNGGSVDPHEGHGGNGEDPDDGPGELPDIDEDQEIPGGSTLPPGGTTNPDPETDREGKGKSGDAPGHTKDREHGKPDKDNPGNGWGKDKEHGKPDKEDSGHGWGKDKDHGKPEGTGFGSGNQGGDKDHGKKDGWAESENNGNGNGPDKGSEDTSGTDSEGSAGDSPGNSGGSDTSNGNDGTPGSSGHGSSDDKSKEDRPNGSENGADKGNGSDKSAAGSHGNGPGENNGNKDDSGGETGV